MRGREMLDTIEHLNPAYIEAAAEKPKAKKAGWRKWGAMAACLCLVIAGIAVHQDRKSTRLNSSHVSESRMPSSA